MSGITGQSNGASDSQLARQNARDNDGRYLKMHRCEFCGARLGEGYHSLSNCNETGVGLVCCKKCCTEREPALESSAVPSKTDDPLALLKWVYERSREGCFSRKRSERDRALSDINYATEKFCK